MLDKSPTMPATKSYYRLSSALIQHLLGTYGCPSRPDWKPGGLLGPGGWDAVLPWGWNQGCFQLRLQRDLYRPKLQLCRAKGLLV